MRHEPTAPTTNEHGDDVHPAFGSINVSRVTSNPGAVLFDSDVQHGEYIRLTVGQMTRQRRGGHDYLHAGSGATFAEVDMSMAQWASLVSSMNTSGVPCTIRRTETNPNVPGLEFAPRLAESMDETRKAAHAAYAGIQAAMDAYENLDPKAGAKARKEALSTLHFAIANAAPNVDFAAKSLAKHTEDVVQKARADVESMVDRRAEQLGVDPSSIRFALGSADVQDAVVVEAIASK